MNAYVRCLCSCLFATVVFAGDPLIDKTEQELLATKGKPTGKVSAGKRTIYQWDDSRITVTDGVVTEVQMRDPKAEQEQRQRGAKMAADQKAAKEARAKAESEKRQVLAGLIEESRRNSLPLLHRVEGEQKRRDKETKERMARIEENSANILALRSEIATLRMQLQRAYAAKDKAATFNLNVQLTAKKKQLELAEKNHYK